MASATTAEADDLDVLDVDGDHEQDDEDLAAELAAGVSEVDLLREALVKPGAGRLGRRVSTAEKEAERLARVHKLLVDAEDLAPSLSLEALKGALSRLITIDDDRGRPSTRTCGSNL